MTTSTQAIVVNCRYLLYLYAVIPFIFIVVSVDFLFLENYLLTSFVPDDPRRWAVWTIVFNIPHIVASWVTFAERQYLVHYRPLFLKTLPIFIVLVYLVHFQFGGEIAFAVFAFYTMYHVLSQQFGLSLMMMRVRPSLDFHLWRIFSVLGTLCVYSVVYGKHLFSIYRIHGIELYDYAMFFGLLFLCLSVPYAFRLSKKSQNQLGSWYLWSNVLMVFSCYLVLYLGYYAFVIVIPRVVHDITAFIVYITHDSNRNREKQVNYFYRLTAFTRLPIWLLCPLIAMALAYPLVHSSNDIVAFITLVLIYFHYYFEHRIWKGGTIHRQQVSFQY